MKNFIAPSILSANFAELGKEVNDVILAGADIIHFDVMDNHYVPNLTIGPLVCKSLADYGVKKPIDVHLTTTPVDDLITQFCDAGASMVSFHPEATQHVDRSIELIKSKNCKAGIALNPASPLSLLDHVLEKIDFILRGFKIRFAIIIFDLKPSSKVNKIFFELILYSPVKYDSSSKGLIKPNFLSNRIISFLKAGKSFSFTW